MSRPGALVLAIETEVSELSGFVICQQAGDEAEVLSLAVRGNVQRQGIGRRLMQSACRILRERGATRLILEVAADNRPALSLYRTLGFLECGRRPGYYVQGRSEPVDALVLDLTL
jgi:ribosomal-protein-alanine N-acetyltransferase